MRTMYDAVTPTNIPRDAQMVAGYVDGIYAWHANDWALFPNAVKVRIAVFSKTNDGHVLDIEPGCSTPASAPGWVTMRRSSGIDPSVYCNTSTWPTVRATFRAMGVAEPHYWIANYSTGAIMYAGSVAHQYSNPGPVDISIVADYWPGVDSATPTPTPIPPEPTNTKEDNTMNYADVMPLYNHYLGRDASPDEAMSWFINGVENNKTLSNIGYEIANSVEGHTYATTYAYTKYLGRAPSASDITFRLGTGQTWEQIVDAIKNSPEAKNRKA